VKVWRTEDRTFRVELHEERRTFRVYWLGALVGTAYSPQQIEELIQRHSNKRLGLADLIED
jgi:hypothetical protein